MNATVTPLCLQTLRELLRPARAKVSVFNELPSTNDYLKQVATPQEIQFCVAESQTQGRGRHQRSWYSPSQENLYLSLNYPFKQEIKALAGLSLVIGLCVCQTLEKLYTLPHPVMIKWPNDVMYQQQKLAGILIEMMSQPAGVMQTIIGIGLNVNMVEAPHDIRQPWTSLKKITHTTYDRNILCAQLMQHLLTSLNTFEKIGLIPFLERWRQKDSLFHKPVKLEMSGKIFSGKGLGVNHLGHFLLEMPQGHILPFIGGDTTVLKE